MRKHQLTGSRRAEALGVLRQGFPSAEIVATQAFDDNGGGIVQFHDPTRRWGPHGTIVVRWDAGIALFSGHYFDVGFDADIDFEYRTRRGY